MLYVRRKAILPLLLLAFALTGCFQSEVVIEDPTAVPREEAPANPREARFDNSKWDQTRWAP